MQAKDGQRTHSAKHQEVGNSWSSYKERTVGGLSAWQTRTSIIVGIVISTLFINVLGLVFPLVLLQTYDRIIPNKSYDSLMILSAIVVAAVILNMILTTLRAFVVSWAEARFELIMGTRIFQRFLKAKLRIFEKESAGTHLDRMAGLMRVKNARGGQVLITLLDLPFGLIYIILIAYLSGILVFVPIVIALILGYRVYRLGSGARGITNERRIIDDRRFSYLIETMHGIHTVKSLGLEGQFLRRYRRLQDKYSNINYRRNLNRNRTQVLEQVASQAVIIFVVGFGALLVIAGSMTIGALAACILLSNRCLQPILKAVGLLASIQETKVAEEMLDKVSSMELEANANLPELTIERGDIELEQVSFSYVPGSEFELKNINLHIEPGELVSITAEGLSGKSTVLWLMMGIYKPTQGVVKIDGHNLAEYDPYHVRNHMAYLAKHGSLFSGTLLDNLTMFRGGEYADRAVQLSHELGLDEIVNRLPHGLDTYISADRSVEAITRGVKQLITFIRALVDQPKILFFDEANAAIDLHSDFMMREMLKKMRGQLTIVLVSQRPSFLKIADKEYVIRNGELKRKIHVSTDTHQPDE